MPHDLYFNGGVFVQYIGNAFQCPVRFGLHICLVHIEGDAVGNQFSFGNQFAARVGRCGCYFKVRHMRRAVSIPSREAHAVELHIGIDVGRHIQHFFILMINAYPAFLNPEDHVVHFFEEDRIFTSLSAKPV
ncbi:hypothetical protein SDC9_199853 [bioreactor metagenome]|uniref:Uncharacterized protein n=1 Tax=bioreactor metagenome TaxID=1076179 RepID=A0A645ILQ9_9ZZZZ